MKDIKSLVKNMTVEEKVGQLIQLSAIFFGTEAELTGPAQSWGSPRSNYLPLAAALAVTMRRLSARFRIII